MDTIVEGESQEHMGLDDVLSSQNDEEQNVEKDNSDDLSKTVEAVQGDYTKLSQKYNSLKGIYTSQNELIKDHQKTIEELAKKIEERSKTSSKDVDYLSPDEANSIVNTRPILDKMLFNTENRVLDQMSNSLNKTSTEVDERVKAVQETSYKTLVRMAHNDLDDILESDEFAEWGLKRNPLANRFNNDLLNEASRNYDAEHAINVLNVFKSEYPEKFNKKDPLVEPSPLKSSDSNIHKAKKIKQSVYKQAFKEHFLDKTMPRDQWLKFKAVYDPALKDGRIEWDV